MGTWWGWLNQGRYHELERVLLKHVPILKRLATIISPFQEYCSKPCDTTKIMQITLACLILNLSESEIHCVKLSVGGNLRGQGYSCISSCLAREYLYCIAIIDHKQLFPFCMMPSPMTMGNQWREAQFAVTSLLPTHRIILRMITRPKHAIMQSWLRRPCPTILS